MPWGGGLGVSRYNEEGNWSALFAMMFKDSHNEWQPAMGYGWEKGWYLDDAKDFRLGLGAAAGITARDDFANYVPLPFIFPLFSAGYKRVTVQFTYIQEPITTATCSLLAALGLLKGDHLFATALDNTSMENRTEVTKVSTISASFIPREVTGISAVSR